MSDDILLESGTNELEVVMFGIAGEIFGINVLKVREIINYMPVTSIPNAHPSVEGIIRLRDEVIPVVNLASVLNLEDTETPDQNKFIISELNQIKVAFHVHHVSRIRRLSWEQIEKPSELSSSRDAYAIGIIKLEEGMSILLDFEKIIVEISPESGVNVERLKELGPRERSEKNILVAEDSAVLRHLLDDTLNEAGYENITFFENGREAWEHLQAIIDRGEDPKDHFQLIISDIEMPQMDGHHLTDRIKNNEHMHELPVIIFSSLITDDIFHKGQQVGASAQVSKPEIVNLVKEIDYYIL
ncbi:MAG TPA: chemotaxis protein [Bacillota bacterium]|nr:chemotaxis protein [Bacillota bacterium]